MRMNQGPFFQLYTAAYTPLLGFYSFLTFCSFCYKLIIMQISNMHKIPTVGTSLTYKQIFELFLTDRRPSELELETKKKAG